MRKPEPPPGRAEPQLGRQFLPLLLHVAIARDGEEASSLLRKVLAAKLGIGKDSNIVSEFGGKRIVREPVPITKDEPLKLELEHFIACVRERQTPLVSGESAKRALDVALEITRQVRAAMSAQA